MQFFPNKQENSVSLPVTSETHKLSFFQLHRQSQRVTRPAVSPSNRGRLRLLTPCVRLPNYAQLHPALQAQIRFCGLRNRVRFLSFVL